jgi:hypothetical protein
VHSSAIDILCITETFLKGEHKSITIPGYSLYRKDRENKGGGGVGILVREHYSVELLNVNLKPEYLEILMLKIQVNKNKSFVIMCVYRPPCLSTARLTSDSECFENILSNMNLSSRNIIITGDFNLPNSNAYSYFEHIPYTHSLKQLVELPTRGENILDLFITNHTNIISDLRVEEPHVSDHRMVVAKVIVPRPIYPTKKITFRDFKTVDFGNLGSDISKLETLPSLKSTASLIQHFSSSISDIFDKHGPLSTKFITEYPRKICLSTETLEKKLRETLPTKLTKVTQLLKI